MFTYNKTFGSFSVNNLEQAKAFYTDKLDLEVRDNEMGVIEIKMKNGETILAYPKPDHVPATFTVLNFVVKNIEETVDELADKGVEFEQYTGMIQTDEKGICRNPSGHAIAWFKDPAGNILSVIEDRD